MRWSFTLNDNYTFFCISILFIISFYILQFEASEYQLVFIKFWIGQVVFRDIKPITTYETHLVEILVPWELGFTDDSEILIQNDNGEFTGSRSKFIVWVFIFSQFTRQVSKVNPHLCLQLGKRVLIWKVFSSNFLKLYVRYHESWFLLFLPLQVLFLYSVCLCLWLPHVFDISVSISSMETHFVSYVFLPFLGVFMPIILFCSLLCRTWRVLNSSYLKPIVFLIDIYIPWSKFYMWVSEI